MNKKYIEKLVALMNERDIDAIFIAPSEDMEFLIGQSPNLCERYSGLYITAKGEMFYVAPLLQREEMQEAVGEENKVYAWADSDGFLGELKKAYQDFGLIGKTIGIDGTARACNLLDIAEAIDVKLVNAKPTLEDMRVQKTEEEINALRKAAAIADEVFIELCKFIEPGLKEKDIADKIKSLFKERGCPISFSPIVASGPNSSRPHYNEDQRVIEKQDVIILDFGCVYNGFCSDMSRTVFVGDITDEQRRIYDIVDRSNKAGEDAAVKGVTCASVDKAARDIIDAEGHGQHFLNRLGHGIGCSVHEAPYIKGGNGRILDTGMAFSIEPGIYIPGKFGMRIEDILVITENGTEILNKAPRDITIIKPE